MPTLRIIPPNITRLRPQTATCTLSGTVKTPLGVALPRRTVRVFGDQGMSLLLGSTQSLADGSFSVTVEGGAGSNFVCVVQGESGENAAVFSKIVKPV